MVKSNAARAASASFRQYDKVINSSLDGFLKKTSGILEDIIIKQEQVSKIAAELALSEERVAELESRYFQGSDENESVEDRVTRLLSEIETGFELIERYRVDLFDGTADDDSIVKKISHQHIEIDETRGEIEQHLLKVESNLSALKQFYHDIFGRKNENDEIVGGLENELKSRRKDLDEFKKVQESRYAALIEQIEEALPGATSAGLATAYHELKESCIDPISNYSKLFYGCLIVLFFASGIFVTNSFSLWPFSVSFVDIGEWKDLILGLLMKLPFVIPVLWLAMFASKRRSEFHRLHQEYAHKEALAKSYQSFKMQIKELSDQDDEMMKKLMTQAIDAIAFNASTTLDKKHGDTTPTKALSEQLVSALERAIPAASKP